MRIQRVKIDKWRHFENIEIAVPDDAPVVCVVGPNGAGKSHILELIAASAHKIGLSPGYDSTRGDPFTEIAHFEIQFFIAQGSSSTLDEALETSADSSGESWDRTLLVKRMANEEQILAGGMEPGLAAKFARTVVGEVRKAAAVHYMFLDADRAYPKININPHQIGDIFQRDWSASQKSSSFRLTRTLYEEWFQYFLGTENQENNAFVQEIRRARAQGRAVPSLSTILITTGRPFKRSFHIFSLSAWIQTRERSILTQPAYRLPSTS